jgi:hypothetical protein
VSGNTGLRRFVAPPPAGQRAPAPEAPAPHALAPEAPAPQASVPQAPAPQAPGEAALPGPVADLLGQAQPSAGPPRPGEETCEFCAAQIPGGHGHVADLEGSTLMCSCRACYLLFTHGQAGRGRYKSIPDRYRSDPGRPLSVAEWDALEIPVGLAFFLRSSGDDAVTAFYPSPAGATECRLDLQAWSRIVTARPMIGAAEADVEAVLISRGAEGVECFLVPVDACYELAGRMRLHWRGFDGGAEARQSIAEFLDGVRARCRDFSQVS